MTLKEKKKKRTSLERRGKKSTFKSIFPSPVQKHFLMVHYSLGKWSWFVFTKGPGFKSSIKQLTQIQIIALVNKKERERVRFFIF